MIIFLITGILICVASLTLLVLSSLELKRTRLNRIKSEGVLRQAEACLNRVPLPQLEFTPSAKIRLIKEVDK
jgi:hypothetical protein